MTTGPPRSSRRPFVGAALRRAAPRLVSCMPARQRRGLTEDLPWAGLLRAVRENSRDVSPGSPVQFRRSAAGAVSSRWDGSAGSPRVAGDLTGEDDHVVEVAQRRTVEAPAAGDQPQLGSLCVPVDLIGGEGVLRPALDPLDGEAHLGVVRPVHHDLVTCFQQGQPVEHRWSVDRVHVSDDHRRSCLSRAGTAGPPAGQCRILRQPPGVHGRRGGGR